MFSNKVEYTDSCEKIINNLQCDKTLVNLHKYRLIEQLAKEESDYITYKIEKKDMIKYKDNINWCGKTLNMKDYRKLGW